MAIRVVSPLGDHDLQIFAWHHHGAVTGLIHAHDECVQIVSEIFLGRRIQSRERLQNWAVEGLENLKEMLGRSITEIEYTRLGLDRTDAGIEHFVEARACAPERRRFSASGRRQISPERFEDLSDEAFWRPVGKTDLSAGFADPQ